MVLFLYSFAVDAINALLGYIERTSKFDGASNNFSASHCNNKSTLDVYCVCYNATCRVTLLYLDDNRFSEIPSWLQNLSMLSIIVLDGNLLGGHIPTFFSQMKSLVTL
ncbi:uncharacterized protein LOC114299280 isoform X2 [Camellia sinensis]|uniref:uncharacterized protein LOC114299280 isoform X2 n=1 Tax=Camellia sinensis TaxID=4442 RepID=UPI0010366098|nr:uncharacterized protein LOC114299280 isoform X2 [Camellia sinensis]